MINDIGLTSISSGSYKDAVAKTEANKIERTIRRTSN